MCHCLVCKRRRVEGAPSACCSPRLGTDSTVAGRSAPFEDADSAPEVAAAIRRQVTVDDHTCNKTPLTL